MRLRLFLLALGVLPPRDIFEAVASKSVRSYLLTLLSTILFPFALIILVSFVVWHTIGHGSGILTLSALVILLFCHPMCAEYTKKSADITETPEPHPEFTDEVNILARGLGIRHVEVRRSSSEEYAAKICLLSRIMVLSVGIEKNMTRMERLGICAHELGHLLTPPGAFWYGIGRDIGVFADDLAHLCEVAGFDRCAYFFAYVGGIRLSQTHEFTADAISVLILRDARPLALALRTRYDKEQKDNLPGRKVLTHPPAPQRILRLLDMQTAIRHAR